MHTRSVQGFQPWSCAHHSKSCRQMRDSCRQGCSYGLALYPVLEIHSDLSRKACVCRAGLGCTKLNSLLNFLVGSSQQQLSSMLKKFIFEIQIYTVECSTCFLNQCFFPFFPVEIRAAIFPEMFKIKWLAPLSEIPDFNWL